MWQIISPPPQYDHPYTGQVTEMILRADEVSIACGNPNARACVYLHLPGGPMMILPKVGRGGVSQRGQDLLRRHEEGHLNGWGADHAGGH